MLKKAVQSDLDEIKAFCKEGVLSTRILCLVECYGFDRDFVEIWLCYTEDNLEAVCVRFDGDMTVLSKSSEVYDEIKAFALMSCCSSFTLNFNPELEGCEAHIKSVYTFCGYPEEYACENIGEADMRRAYNLISENISDSFSSGEEAYLSFLSDFTFRKMRGKARAKGEFSPELIACGITAAETQFSALLSGIASDKKARGRGAGKRVVLSLAQELMREGKKVYVIALNDSAGSFYEHIGFKPTETVYILKGNKDV